MLPVIDAAVGVAVAVAVAVGVNVAVAVGVNVAVAVGVNVAVDVAVDVGVGETADCGLSAIKIAAHGLLLETVADPAPVEPAAAFIAHPAAAPCWLGVTSPYISFRAPGDVAVASEVIVLASKPAANITTAAPGDTVVIEVTPEIFPLPVV